MVKLTENDGPPFFVSGVHFPPDNSAFVKPDEDYFDMLATVLMLIDNAEQLIFCCNFNAPITNIKFQKIESVAENCFDAEQEIAHPNIDNETTNIRRGKNFMALSQIAVTCCLERAEIIWGGLSV